eukprot:2069359-Prymnesium_polylepis.1
MLSFFHSLNAVLWYGESTHAGACDAPPDALSGEAPRDASDSQLRCVLGLLSPLRAPLWRRHTAAARPRRARPTVGAVSYTHLRAHETLMNL